MIGKVRVTSTGYDPDGPRVNDPTLGPTAALIAHLEDGVYGRGDSTDVYPDWVYEARNAIRRQNENPPHFLKELCEALGWQGGTIHQALTAVRRLVEVDKERNRR